MFDDANITQNNRDYDKSNKYLTFINKRTQTNNLISRPIRTSCQCAEYSSSMSTCF